MDIPVGAPATAKELRWQSWPSDGTSSGMIIRSARPQAVQEFTGAIARTTLLQGEPIRTERLAKIDQGGVMSALLPPGQRALAISIDNRGTNSAGNFILPNDRVDVIRIYKDDAGSERREPRGLRDPDAAAQRPRSRDRAEHPGAQRREDRGRRDRDARARSAPG